MDSSTAGRRLRRKDLFDVWRSTSRKYRLKSAIDLMKSYCPKIAFDNQQDQRLKTFLKGEHEKFRQKWVKKNRRLDIFKKTYGKWLEEEINFEIRVTPADDNANNTMVPIQGTSSGVGRPEKAFQESSVRSKRRKAKKLIETFEEHHLSLAVEINLRASGKRDAANLIKEHATSSPKRATAYKTTKQRTRTDGESEKRPYTSDEALALFVSHNVTVQQYKNLQQEAKERGYNLYPSYKKLQQTKQNCYPPIEKIEVTDISAEINLQALVDHTATRICRDILGEVFLRPDFPDINYCLTYKWGCDGSSGHSLYKQAFKDPESTDEYMFIMSLVPIKLVALGSDKLIWQNPRPSSARFCRIIRFLYKKESNELIKEECDRVEKDILSLRATQIYIKEKTVYISHNFILSMIDGKVCNVLSDNKSTQKCFICKASGKDLNSLEPKNEPDTQMYRFGISSLHARLRIMECLLNIGFDKKKVVKKRKEEIQKKFKEIGLIIDKVKPGFGTSNDGNTARRFFKEYRKSANILGLDENLIYRLSILLKALSSGHEIDSQKFHEYCNETRKLYLNLYSWYSMPVTLHKVLVHGGEIIKHCIIPIGQMCEEASEAKNKEIRKVRLGHTCKKSRERSNFDLIKNLLVSSDPYITLLRKLPKKTTALNNQDFMSLLK